MKTGRVILDALLIEVKKLLMIDKVFCFSVSEVVSHLGKVVKHLV